MDLSPSDSKPGVLCCQTSGAIKSKRPSPTAAINPSSDSLQAVSSSASTSSQALTHTTTNSELTSLFECPVCFDYVLPPILQCQNGHLVCQTCRQKITCCPTCRVPIASNIRNLPMEKLASTMMFPCKYCTSGCAAQLIYTEKPDHEDSCEYKPYSCPCPGMITIIAFSFN